MARIAPSERIVKLVAATEPNETPVEFRKPVPKMVTGVPPVDGPPAASQFAVGGTVGRPATTGAADPPGGTGVLRPMTLTAGPVGLVAELLKVNWSADEVGEVPTFEVTVTSMVPADSAGETAIIDVSELIVKYVAATVPNETPVTLVKLVPVMVIVVPPPVGPVDALRFVTTGTPGVANVYWSLEETADVPSGVVTVMSTSPTECAGETAVMEVGEFKTNEAPGTPPKLTAEAPKKFEPLIVMEVPPAVVPLVLSRPVMTGAGD